MIKQRKVSMGKHSAIAGIAIGMAVVLVISFVLTAGLTSLIINGKLSEGTAGVFVFVIRAISVLAGGLVATTLVKERCLPIVGAVAAVYLLVLLGTGIAAFDGSFKNFIPGIMSVLIGGILACMIKLKPQKKRKTTARYTR